ncbi:predicted protein [Naegleria gruberi]|uniref:ATP-dependent RNA helicase n=1 Tax=Naegleria gruberi TaxID=5762 RepID=D2VMD7_NAEGR|nr:uncharacterized protein NAEGRDRAFT_50744 [Naegleria gruberi]EFC41970.1 predicted protein [Naegleria gruberi]|eukprot:XP_002674714.1 predicted protein [Naegleria gruberi strain NEG-M]
MLDREQLVFNVDVAFIVQSFLNDSDRRNCEQVSINFHRACNTLERLEFRDRLQNVELNLIREKFDKSSIASSPKRVFSSAEEVFNEDIEMEIEAFERKHIKIPFHLKEYLRMSVHLDPYLILDILKEYVFMHPLTVLCPLSDWIVIREGEEYLIGEFSNSSGRESFIFTLNQKQNGKCSIFMTITKNNNFGYDQIISYTTKKRVEIGTLKRWFNNYGFGWFVNRNIFHYSFHNSLQRNHLDLFQISRNTTSSFNSQHIYNLIKNYKFVFPGALMEKYSIDLLREGLITLKQLKENLRKDPRIIDMAVRCNGLNLEFVGKEYHRNEEMVRKAISQNGLALKFASKSVRMNKDIVEMAYRQNKYALKYSLLSPKEDSKTISDRFLKYFSFNQDPNCEIETLFPNNDYLLRCIYGFGLEYFSQYQVDMIKRCQREDNTAQNILFQAPSVGKTLASLIVALERIQKFKSILGSGIHCLILCPNRELVIKVARLFSSLLMWNDINIITAHGGHIEKLYFYNYETYMPCTPMEVDFSRKTETSPNPSILIGTPGRLALDDLRSGMFELNKVHTIIYEEADTLLSGEYDSLTHIMREIEEYNPNCKLMNIVLCQTLTERMYFKMNTTFNQNLEYFYKEEKFAFLKPLSLLRGFIDHEIVSVEDLSDTEVHNLKLDLLKKNGDEIPLLVAFGNRRSIERYIDGNQSILISILHSDMEQRDRELVWKEANELTCQVLSTTDINSNAMLLTREIHTVFQFDFPSSEEIFIKRIRYALFRENKMKVITFVNSKKQERRILKWLR